MNKHKVIKDGADGWSEWQQPIFEVLRRGASLPNGDWKAVPLDPEKYRVSLRMRRNTRSTAQIRRHQSK